MRKYWLISFFAIFSILNFAQNVPDLKEIKKSVNDPASPYFYEKLVYQFNFNPGKIDAAEAEHLYYGKIYANYKIPFSKDEEISRADLNGLIKAGNYKQAIVEGEKMVRNAPADIEVLGLLMYSLLQTDQNQEDLKYLRGYQFQKLIDVIIKNRSGTDINPIYTVTSIPDEYVIAGILKLDLKKFRRKTVYNTRGAMDIWKKGRERISFQVVYE